MSPTEDNHSLALLAGLAQHFGLDKAYFAYQRQTANPGSIPLCGDAPVSRSTRKCGSDRLCAPYFFKRLQTFELRFTIPLREFCVTL